MGGWGWDGKNVINTFTYSIHIFRNILGISSIVSFSNFFPSGYQNIFQANESSCYQYLNTSFNQNCKLVADLVIIYAKHKYTVCFSMTWRESHTTWLNILFKIYQFQSLNLALKGLRRRGVGRCNTLEFFVVSPTGKVLKHALTSLGTDSFRSCLKELFCPKGKETDGAETQLTFYRGVPTL